MKSVKSILSVCALVSATFIVAENAGAASKKESAKPDLPTDAEIAAFKTTWTDDSGTAYRFRANFGLTKPKPANLERYKKSGALPIRVTARLWAGKKLIKDADAEIFVLDSDGKAVIKETIKLAKLCPS
jgi:hypothetical protein